MLSKVISHNNIERVRDYIDESDRIVIVTHVSPDGDALGSSLGLKHFLESQGKEVSLITPNTFPDFLGWMSGAKDVVRYDKNPETVQKLLGAAQLLFCLDFNTISRVKELGEPILSTNCPKVMIDHHLNPDDFCDVTISHPNISSTSELVFRLICRLGCFDDISFEGAECIYTGMMTDTGGFTYNSNNMEIYFIISELLSKGIDKDEIYRRVFYTYSENRLRLMGYILYEKMQVYPDFNCALIWLTKEEQKRFAFAKGDTEGMVNLPLQIKNVKFSVFLREDTEKPIIKVSLRSVGSFPCNKLAAEFFNGGGHLNASGGEIHGTMDEALEVFKQAMIRYEDLLKKN